MRALLSSIIGPLDPRAAPAPPGTTGPAPGAGAGASAEAILHRDPGGVYVRSDPRTQSQYHAALSGWEHRTGGDSLTLARGALVRAEATFQEEGPGAPGAHIGYHLLGHGARALQAELLPASAGAGTRPRGLHPGLLVPLTVALASVFVLASVAVVHRGTAPGWAEVLFAAAALPLAAVYTSRITRALPWRRRPMLPLPRLRAGEGWESDEATLVVVPAIVSSTARARALVQRLWTISKVHPAPEFRFALLSDFVDAPAETAPGDEDVLAELRAGIAALNARARDGRGDRFFALHRHRTWSDTENAWIGWERKRGKLREVMRLLQPDPPPTTFTWRFGDLPGLLSHTTIPFVITLDESTWLDPGAAAELVRTAAHPLNRPVVDAATGRVTSGYTVLQPAVAFTLDAAAEASGGCGDEDPPRAAGPARGPGFYFRTFDVGIHRGAGALYHVGAFRRVIDGAFPDERVLQHDLLDGFAGRTGEVYEAVVRQPYSRSYLAQARRGHRWLRGVFQALPFLFPGSRPTSRARRLNPLTGIQRFFIAELALLEMSTPASLVCLLLAWTVLPGSPAVWTLLACPALLVLAVSMLYQAALVPVGRLRGLRRPGWGAALNRAAAGLFAQVVLVHQAWLVADALARVAWRLAVSGKHLLQWALRDDSASAAAAPLSAYWRALWAAPAAGVLLLAALAWGRPAVSWIAAPFAVAWIAAPVLVGLGDRYLFSSEGPA